MPACPRTRAARAAACAVGAVGVVLLALTGCAPTGDEATEVTPSNGAAYPEVQTYPDIDVVEDVQYGAAEGQALLLDVCLPVGWADRDDDEAARPAVLSIHGGSWARGDKGNLNWRSVCQWIASEGFVAFSVNYRLAPEYPYPAGLDDVTAAVEWVRGSAETYAVDPDRIGVFGGSAGGNLAAMLGVQGDDDSDPDARVAAVAELSGPTDLTAASVRDGSTTSDFVPVLQDYLRCDDLDACPQAALASPMRYVDGSDPPFFVAHSVDERIPYAQSADFVEALRDAGVEVEFLRVEGARHSIAMLDDQVRGAVVDFLRDQLDFPQPRSDLETATPEPTDTPLRDEPVTTPTP